MPCPATTAAATLDVAVVAVAGVTAPCYALFAVENEFGNRACKQLTKATIGGTAAAPVQRLRLGGTHAAQLHVDVFAAAAGSQGAAAWDDAHVGEARVWLSQLPADGSAATMTVPLESAATAATVTLSLALVHDAALALPVLTPTAMRAATRDVAVTYAAQNVCEASTDDAAHSSCQEHDDPVAARVAELERELAELRGSRLGGVPAPA